MKKPTSHQIMCVIGDFLTEGEEFLRYLEEHGCTVQDGSVCVRKDKMLTVLDLGCVEAFIEVTVTLSEVPSEES